MDMKIVERYLEDPVIADLQKKMVFVSGPRQSGKTTFARSLLPKFSSTLTESYMNWDSGVDRDKILREQFPAGNGLLVLDEIHKYGRWRQVVKGLYDKRKDELKILVTGSGRLDYYGHGGDSLQGRYHMYRLHPLSLPELTGDVQQNLEKLMRYSGFPEPFLEGSERAVRRWSREYHKRVIDEDLNSLENVKDVSIIALLVARLPAHCGSPLSLNSLSNVLQVSHNSVQRWLQMLENLYLIFRLYPFGSPIVKAVKKEAKHYHFDWTVIEEDGIRFENLTACHLLKWVHFQQDYEGLDYELRYFRDVDRREVDFIITLDGNPLRFIECKMRYRETSRSLVYLKRKFPAVEALQVIFYGDDDFIDKHGVRIMPAARFLNTLL